MAIKLNWMIPINHRNYNNMSASVWIRCLQLIPYLERLGIKSVINEFNERSDISIFVRWQDEKAYQLAKQLKARGNRIVFDLCVNNFDEAYVPIFGQHVTKGHIDETLRMVSVADLITTASDYIAQRAREFHPTVEYLADSIDFEHFQYTKSIDDFYRPTLRAIWSGISSKAGELEPILPILYHHGIELVVISDSHPLLKINARIWGNRFPYHFLSWRYETFPKNILRGDICISHRPVDNPYNMGHSFFKIGVFMAQGVPSLASPQPSYQELVKSQGGGRICTTLDDWDVTIAKILKDREMLAQFSREAHRGMQNYSTLSIAKRYAQLFAQIVMSQSNSFI